VIQDRAMHDAGLVGHVHEEQQRPAMRELWQAAEDAVLYDGNIPR